MVILAQYRNVSGTVRRSPGMQLHDLIGKIFKNVTVNQMRAEMAIKFMFLVFLLEK